jgi:hypothetical protein
MLLAKVIGTHLHDKQGDSTHGTDAGTTSLVLLYFPVVGV